MPREKVDIPTDGPDSEGTAPIWGLVYFLIIVFLVINFIAIAFSVLDWLVGGEVLWDSLKHRYSKVPDLIKRLY